MHFKQQNGKSIWRTPEINFYFFFIILFLGFFFFVYIKRIIRYLREGEGKAYLSLSSFPFLFSLHYNLHKNMQSTKRKRFIFCVLCFFGFLYVSSKKVSQKISIKDISFSISGNFQVEKYKDTVLAFDVAKYKYLEKTRKKFDFFCFIVIFGFSFFTSFKQKTCEEPQGMRRQSSSFFFFYFV